MLSVLLCVLSMHIYFHLLPIWFDSHYTTVKLNSLNKKKKLAATCIFLGKPLLSHSSLPPQKSSLFLPRLFLSIVAAATALPLKLIGAVEGVEIDQCAPLRGWEVGVLPMPHIACMRPPPAGLGKIYREPRTEPNLPRTGTESTGTEEVRFCFSSQLSGTEVYQLIRFLGSVNRGTEI